MHGNVWEWTADKIGDYSSTHQIDPTGGESGWNRVFRGGSWNQSESALRSARRAGRGGDDSQNNIGFRVGFQIQPDEASPELELFGGADIPHKRDEPWAEPGFGASDVRDGNLTSSVSISGTVDVNTTGTYTLTYTVSDAAGNEANATRTVAVIDSGTDTDGDGFDDFAEAVAGTDSNDPASYPWDFSFGYKNVLEPHVEDYVVFKNSMEKITFTFGDVISFWAPTGAGYESQLIYHFPLEEPA